MRAPVLPVRGSSLIIVPLAKRCYSKAFGTFGQPEDIEASHVSIIRVEFQLLRYP